MTIAENISVYQTKLTELYDADEAAAISFLVFESILNCDRNFLFNHPMDEITFETESLLKKHLSRLANSEPVQYVLGEAWFCDLKFKVDRNVLIPRPETEELVYRIISENKNAKAILDIGTGSGCIAIALRKNLPGVTVFASDISEKALLLATENASANACNIAFISDNILMPDVKKYPDDIDVIVSNPPYVTETEKKDLHKNVLEFEPHIALFCGNSPLIFYEHIAQFAQKKLRNGGFLYFEINPLHADELVRLLRKSGFENITIRKDISAKPRMLRCVSKK